MRFPQSEGYSLVTLKKTWFKGILLENLWFLNCVPKEYLDKGFDNTNIKFLVDNDCQIWTDWPYDSYIKKGGNFSKEEFIDRIKKDDLFAKNWGSAGPIYGKQWLDFTVKTSLSTSVNQIKNAQETLKKNPNSRRNIVTAWNPLEIDQMALPPCHSLFQLVCEPNEDESLPMIVNLHMFQRSWDVILGAPFNIAGYSLLLRMFALTTGLMPGDVVISSSDTHIYLNHLEAAEELSIRKIIHTLPDLDIVQKDNIFDYNVNDFKLINYNSYPGMKLQVAV